jgi:hypothetical protein
MRVSVGRRTFFDKLAEGLQSFFVSGMPRRLALSHVQPEAGADDLRSLAYALCRLHAPELENIPMVRWSDKDWEPCATAAVVDADGRTLREVADKIRDWAGAPSVLTVLLFEDDGTEFARLKYDPRQQSDLVSEALETLFNQCGARVSALGPFRYAASRSDRLSADCSFYRKDTFLGYHHFPHNHQSNRNPTRDLCKICYALSRPRVNPLRCLA